MKNQQAGFIGVMIIAIVALALVVGAFYLYSNDKFDFFSTEPEIVVSQEDTDYMLEKVDEYIKIANGKITKGNDLLKNISTEFESNKVAYELAVSAKPNDPKVIEMVEMVTLMKKIQTDMQDAVESYEELLGELEEKETQINAGQISKDDFSSYISETRQEMEEMEAAILGNVTKLMENQK